VLVIEEPEATIHPGALGAILDLLRHASRHMQLIVTTHSPDVLDADWLRDEDLRIVTWEEGATRILPLAGGTQEALREHLMSAGNCCVPTRLRATPITPAPSRKPSCSRTWRHEPSAHRRGAWRGRGRACHARRLRDLAQAYPLEINPPIRRHRDDFFDESAGWQGGEAGAPKEGALDVGRPE